MAFVLFYRALRKTSVILTTLTCLLLGNSKLQAQLIANFSPDKTGGCSPLTVSFTNTTTGASASATYSWNFGNGNTITTSDAVTPVAATYFAAQTYTVTLTVHDGGRTSSKSVVLNVYKSPGVDFTVSNPTGCLPLTTSFSSVSVPGDGFITNYFWDFGDGNTLSTSSPTVSNTYNFAGGHSVSLTVTNSFGCTNTRKKDNLVMVFPAVTAAFTADSTTLCSLSDPVQFKNLSTGGGVLTYSWNFGDGANSTSQNPSHQYALKGTYTVQLTVTSAQGCSSTLAKKTYINAANLNPDFSSASPLCTGNSIIFTDKSNPTPTGNPLWDFGDGASGIGTSVSHQFPAAGNYLVTITNRFGNCVVSQSKNITISNSPVTGGFLINKGILCQSPMLVNFDDTTQSSAKWLWNFTGNPGDTSTIRNPSFLYTTNGIYKPTLTVTDTNGCSTTVSETLNSAQPTATIRMDTTLTPSNTICATVDAKFTAISQDTLSQFNWSFGDGTTSTNPNPTHTFSTPGTYIINLSFVTNHGCTGNAFPPDTVRVYPKPHAAFFALDSLPCRVNQLEEFINQSDPAAQFFWIWGDGNSGVDNDSVIYRQYQKTGNYTFTLIASSPGCKSDTAVQTKYLKTGPSPYIGVTNNCIGDRNSVILTDTAAGADSYIWVYGDGSPNDTNTVYIQQRTHVYAKPGNYVASIITQYGPCTYTNSTPVYILSPQHPLLTTTATTVCASGQLPVQISGLDTNFQAVAKGSADYYNIVTWQYKDSTTISPQGNTGFPTTYNGTINSLKPGSDSIRVIIQSKYFSCYDTSNYIGINVSGPVAGFGVKDHVCYYSPVIFTDSSKGTNGVPIVKWQWNFGDGNSVTDTISDTVMHTYAFPGNYVPSLTVTDSNGCTAKAKLPFGNVVINGAKADFYWNPTDIAPGSPVTFYNSSIGAPGVTYKWYFSNDGSTSSAPDSVIHAFPNFGNDTVRLVANGSAAGICTDTSVQLVIVKNIFANFTYTTQYINRANCPPMVAYFKSNTFNADSLHWDFGDGATAENNPNPSHTYNLPGVYLVTLTAYGANGISTSSQDSVTVKGPFAILRSSILQACIPALDTLHATASYADSYTWDFGDGTVITTKDTLATHTYIIPGVFTPALILTDSTGCQATFPFDNKLIMDTLHVTLGPPVLSCDTGIVVFNPKVLSMVADSLQEPLTYYWKFGTGNDSLITNTANQSFDYATRGKFLVRLQVQAPSGCSVAVNDSVFIVPTFVLQYPADTTICIGNSVPMQVNGADHYEWQPNSSLSNIKDNTAIAMPDVSTVYTVIGTEKYHCFADTAKITVIVKPLPIVTTLPRITIPAGNSLNLEANGSPDIVSWNWSPPTYLSCADCSSPVCKPDSPITYKVTVTTANGCSASAPVTVMLACTENAIRVPNAFTPNHDGLNDRFRPLGHGLRTIKYFRVFSRWGDVLYSRENVSINDKTVGWDGTFKGSDMPIDTYVYILEVECFTGESFFLKGTVELIR